MTRPRRRSKTLDTAFVRFLRLDGDASADTIRGYHSQLAI